jgi:hypothetical protein
MFKYIADIINVDLTFEQSDDHVSKDQSNDLIDYSDSDFVDLKGKRHSTREYVFMLIDEAITHSSKQ